MPLRRTLASTLVPVALLGSGAPATRAGVATQPAPEVTVAPNGSRPSQRGAAETFTGAVRIDPLFDPNESAHAGAAYVTFEPAARTAWHTHPRGQRLVVTAGVGRVQGWGGAVNEIRPGDVVWIAPGVKHWHGASPTTAVTHVAVQEAQNGTVVTWLEKVTDAQYTTQPHSR